MNLYTFLCRNLSNAHEGTSARCVAQRTNPCTRAHGRIDIFVGALHDGSSGTRTTASLLCRCRRLPPRTPPRAPRSLMKAKEAVATQAPPHAAPTRGRLMCRERTRAGSKAARRQRGRMAMWMTTTGMKMTMCRLLHEWSAMAVCVCLLE